MMPRSHRVIYPRYHVEARFSVLTIHNSSEIGAVLVLPLTIWMIYASFFINCRRSIVNHKYKIPERSTSFGYPYNFQNNSDK